MLLPVITMLSGERSACGTLHGDARAVDTGILCDTTVDAPTFKLGAG